MPLNKSTSVFIIFVALTVKGGGENKTTTMFDADFCKIEVLKGRVKKLSQDFEFRSADREIETINFDRQGNQTQLNLSYHWLLKYRYTYDANGKKLEATDSVSVYKYDKKGRITEIILLGDSNKVLQSYKLKYNSTGDIITYMMDAYNALKIDTFNVVKYKYDSRHFLIESDNLRHGKYTRFLSKVNYEYKSFDSVGNWVKVVAHYELGTDTISRKISYY